MENSKKVTSEEKLIALLKKISAKGHNAEVKQDKNGTWIVYDVKKERTQVG